MKAIFIRLSFVFGRKIPFLLGLPPRGVSGAQPLRLEFGCGPKLSPNYVGVDIRAFPGVRFICPAWKAGNYIPAHSVDEISSRHFFEHLTFAQADLTLRCWTKLLKPNAKLRIVVPDMDYHIRQFCDQNWEQGAEFNSQFSTLEHACAGFWGWQHEGETRFWDVHKSGFNFKLLKRILEQYGFSEIHRLPDKEWNLTVECLYTGHNAPHPAPVQFGPSLLIPRQTI